MTLPRKWLFVAELGKSHFCFSFPPVRPLEPFHESAQKWNESALLFHFCQAFSTFTFSLLSHFCSTFASVNTPNVFTIYIHGYGEYWNRQVVHWVYTRQRLRHLHRHSDSTTWIDAELDRISTWSLPKYYALCLVLCHITAYSAALQRTFHRNLSTANFGRLL